MLDKINVSCVFKAYFKCLKDSKGNKNYCDYFLFFIFPGVFSILGLYLHVKLTEKIVPTLLSIVALSVPLLISILILMYNLGQNTKNTGKTSDKELQVDIAKETSVVLIYIILLCVFTTISLGILSLNNGINETMTIICSLIVFYLIVAIVLNILMVLKRLHVLISKSFE
ncbi:MAG: hypothetical protein LBT66_05365 [Methanobrevibacter sp.]|jgi:uncharacterized membrane protein YhaH (DUF805 family)|nr:hypothetical protein [Candidatus Methanovirga meridionalis]